MQKRVLKTPLEGVIFQTIAYFFKYAKKGLDKMYDTVNSQLEAM